MTGWTGLSGLTALAVLGALAGAIGLAGCGGGGSSPGGPAQPINVERFRLAVRPIAADGGPTCPIPFDIARAASRAHLSGAAGPGPAPGSSASSSTDPVADGDEATSSEADSRAAQADPFHSRLSSLAVVNGVYADCRYHVGRSTVVVRTYAAARKGSVGLALPLISHDAHVGADELERYVGVVRKAKTGTPVPVADGRVVGARLPVEGPGDALLVIVADQAMTPKQASSLTRTVADQLS